tara:strand:- start:99 stop:467 length:369 start_codon:yes stop_codon:yes gene_type:complete
MDWAHAGSATLVGPICWKVCEREVSGKRITFVVCVGKMIRFCVFNVCEQRPVNDQLQSVRSKITKNQAWLVFLHVCFLLGFKNQHKPRTEREEMFLFKKAFSPKTFENHFDLSRSLRERRQV